MKFYLEGLENFKAWSGGKDTLDEIVEHGKLEEANELLSEIFPEAVKEVTINDYLWFERDSIFEMLGIPVE